MKPVRKSLATLLSGATLLASFAAPAAPFTVGATDTTTPDQETLSFLRFDSALGTLTGVTFSLTSDIVDIGSTVEGSFSFGEGGNASARTDALFEITGPTSLFSESGSALSSCDVFTGGNCSSATDSATPPTFPLSVSVNSPADLSPFIGLGSFDVFVTLGVSTLVTDCESNSGPPESCSSTGSARWEGTLVVSYQFTPPPSGVPEPASLALLGLGLAGLGWSRRRRE